MWRRSGVTSKIGTAIRQGNVSMVHHLITNNPLWKGKYHGGYNLLRDAIEYRQNEIAKLLMRNGANVNSRYRRPINTPLHFAVRNCDIEIVGLLIDTGADVNARNANGLTALHYATGSTEMLNIALLLLYHGANVNAKDNDDRTPLIYAIRNNSINIVNAFLDHGADVNAQSSCGIIILRIEDANGRNDVVNLLLTNDVNKIGQYGMDESPFYIALEERRTEFAKRLLARGTSLQFESVFWKMYTPLHMACNNGLNEMVELLLRRGAKVNAVTACKSPPSTLQLDVRREYRHIAGILLEDNASVNLRTDRHARPFHFAVQEGRKGVLRLEVERGDDDKATYTGDEFTALYLAIEGRHIDIVQILLDYGADINLTTEGGKTPLHFATEKGTEEICRLLLQRGADVNARNILGTTSLVLALQMGRRNIAQILLQHGADVNLATETSLTALHVSAYKGMEEMCWLLIEMGANVNAQDAGGRTALHEAAQFAHKHIVQILLNRGADVNSKTGNGKTPLYSAMYRGVEEICRLLLETGADVHARDIQGYTALNIATQHRHRHLARILLQNGADVNSRTETDFTPLHVAVQQGVEEICWLLIDTGADVHAKDKNGSTALHVAARRGHIRIVDILLNSFADIDSIDHYGNTALHLACKYEHADVILSLIENGSDVNVVNYYGKTAFDILENPKFTCTDDEDDFSDDSNSETYFSPHVSKYNVIQQLLVKMQIATLGNLRKFRISTIINGRSYFENKCDKEIRRMKNTEINNTDITFHDILTKRIDQIVVYARNENFVRALKLNKYKKQFPEYADIIETRFNKAMVRKMLLDKGENVLHFDRSRFDYLPQNCIQKILNYLTNAELDNLERRKYWSNI